MSVYRHHTYNRDQYPLFVMNNGNWDICADERGYCAAIPTAEAAQGGCLASHFGDLGYVRATLKDAPPIVRTRDGRYQLAFADPVC